MIGKRVSHYLIESELGRGGMGVVYRARDSRLNRWVAIKAIQPELAQSQPLSVRRLREEAATTAQLDHPYICKVYEVLEQDEGTLIVMEWVQGETLKERMKRGLSPGQVLRYFTELAEALESAHAHQLVHRDIKPSNVMITQHDHVKLMDFGLVKTLSQETLSGADTTSLTAPRVVLGTLPYMSPEQACGEPLDQRSDIFSLGVVMFEALSGKLPFRGADHQSHVQALLRGEPERLSELREGVPPEFESVTLRCLERAPENRFPSARALLEALHSLEPIVGGARPGARFRRGWRTAAFASAILILAGLLFWTNLGRIGSDQREFPLLESIVTGPGSKYGSRISPDQEWISFVSDRKGQTILNLTRVGRVQPQALVTDENITSHVWSPDGTSIAYLSETAPETHLRIVEAPLHSGPPRRDEVLQGPLSPRLIRWIGNHLYLSSYQSLWRFDLERSDLTQLARKPADFEFWRHFDVSSDERRLVFSATKGNQEDLYVSALDGSHPRSLTSDSATQEVPRWVGRAGREVVFTSNRGGQMDLWKVSVDTGELQQLTSSRSAEWADDTSSDGLLISFQEVERESDIWLASPDGAPSQLTADSRYELGPTVERDSLAFQRSRAAGLETGLAFFDAEIMLAIEEYGGVGQAETLGPGFAPRFSPGGRWISFLRLGTVGPYRTELWVRELKTGREKLVDDRYQLSAFHEFPPELLAVTRTWSEQEEVLYYVGLDSGNSPRVVRYHPQTEERRAETDSFGPGEELRDLHLSSSGSHLVFLHWKPEASFSRFVLLVEDLETRKLARWAEWNQDRPGRVLVRGWTHDNALLVLESGSDDEGDSVALLALAGPGKSRQIARIPGAISVTFQLARDRQRLFFTGVEGGIHDAFQLSLMDGSRRRITGNHDETVSFGSYETDSSGRLYFSRQQEKQDIGLLRYPR